MAAKKPSTVSTPKFTEELVSDGEEIVVPVIEEVAYLDKEIVETGRVRVSKTVREIEEIIDEPLLERKYQSSVFP